MSKTKPILRGQLSLLGDVPRERRRVALDATSWVEHVPRWLANDKALFDTLAQVAA